MPIDPLFKEVGSFDPTDVTKGSAELARFEDNVNAAFRRTAAQALPHLTTTSTKNTDYESKLDELVPVDTSSGSTITIRIPAATVDNQGRQIGILRLSSAGAVRLISLSDIDTAGTAFFLPLTTGLYLYQSQGA